MKARADIILYIFQKKTNYNDMEPTHYVWASTDAKRSLGF